MIIVLLLENTATGPENMIRYEFHDDYVVIYEKYPHSEIESKMKYLPQNYFTAMRNFDLRKYSGNDAYPNTKRAHELLVERCSNFYNGT